LAALLCCVPQLSQQTKRATLLSGVFGERAHGHQSPYLDALEPSQLLEQVRQELGAYPALLGFPGTIHLDQHRLAIVCLHPPVELGCEVSSINRVDERKPAGGMPGLVPLQRADQVPFDRGLRQRGLLLQRLLNPVLTDIPEACRSRCPHRLETMRLGNRYDPDRVVPTSGQLTTSYNLAHGSQPARKAWEIHNPAIYREMLRY
jgi:hypothetical protein